MNPAPPSGSRFLHTLEALRGVAAVLVMLQHVTLLAHNYLDADFVGGIFRRGSFRIDIFFVLSGFFAVWTHRGGTGLKQGRGFWVRRLLRLVPLLWLLTSAKLLLLGISGESGRHSGLDAFQIFRSYTMIPAEGYPILLPAWTLSLELVFSSGWALSLALGKRWGGVLIGLWLTWILVSGLVLQTSGTPFLAAVGNPYMMEFLAGAGAAWTLHQGWWSRNSGVVFLITGLTFLVFQFGYGDPDIAAIDLATRCLWGAGVAGCILGMAILERHRVVTWTIPSWWRRVSRSSYAIYLSHSLVLVLGFTLIQRWLPDPGSSTPLLLGLLSVAALTVGLLIHHWIEVPLLNRVQRKKTR